MHPARSRRYASLSIVVRWLFLWISSRALIVPHRSIVVSSPSGWWSLHRSPLGRGTMAGTVRVSRWRSASTVLSGTEGVRGKIVAVEHLQIGCENVFESRNGRNQRTLSFGKKMLGRAAGYKIMLELNVFLVVALKFIFSGHSLTYTISILRPRIGGKVAEVKASKSSGRRQKWRGLYDHFFQFGLSSLNITSDNQPCHCKPLKPYILYPRSNPLTVSKSPPRKKIMECL